MHWLLKAIGIVLVLVIVSVSLVAAKIYSDVDNLQRNFQSQQKLLVVTAEGIPEAGMVIGNSFENVSFLDEDNLARARQSIDLQEMLGQYYLLFKIDIADLPLDDGLQIDTELFTVILSKKTIINLMHSSEPKSILIAAISEEYDLTPATLEGINTMIDAQFGDPIRLKSAIFGLVTQDVVEYHDPLFFLDLYKKGELIIYPEMFVFKVLNMIPENTLQEYIGKVDL